VAISLLFIPKWLQIRADTDASSVVPGAPSSPHTNSKTDATNAKGKATKRIVVGSKVLSAESNNDYSAREESGPPTPGHANGTTATAVTGTAVADADGTSQAVTVSSGTLGAGFAANRAARLSQKAKSSQRVSPDA
jgi:hypothetical protein